MSEQTPPTSTRKPRTRKPSSEGKTPAEQLSGLLAGATTDPDIERGEAHLASVTSISAQGGGGRSATGDNRPAARGERTTAAERKAIREAAAAAAARATAAAARPTATIPATLPVAKLRESLRTLRAAGALSVKREALCAEVLATARKHPKDAGWKFIAGLEPGQIATLIGSHVERLAGAVGMLAKGGAVPDKPKQS